MSVKDVVHQAHTNGYFYAVLMFIEHGFGKTRYGSTIGFTVELLKCTLRRLFKTKSKEDPSK